MFQPSCFGVMAWTVLVKHLSRNAFGKASSVPFGIIRQVYPWNARPPVSSRQRQRSTGAQNQSTSNGTPVGTYFPSRNKDRHWRELKGDSHQIWRTQRVQVNGASLRLFLRSSTGPNRAFEPQSLGRVRDPVRIAEGPAHDFGFSILDFGLRTEATRLSLREAPARGEGFLVDSLHEGERTGPPNADRGFHRLLKYLMFA